MHAFVQRYLRVPFVRDLATLQVGQVVGTACGFLSSILFARLLGLGGYGQYAVVLAFTGMFGFVTNLGQGATAVTFLAEAHGRQDRAALARVLHYYLTVSLLTMLILTVLLPFLPAITEAIYGDATFGRWAQIIFLSSLIDPIFTGMAIALQTAREIRTLTILENGRITVQLGLGVLLLLAGYGVAGMLLGALIGTGIFAIIALGFYPRLRRTHGFPSLREILGGGNGASIWRYARDGFWIAVDKNIANLYPTLFLFLLSTRAPESVVGLLRLAFKLGNLPASFVLGNISRMASSVIPTLAARGIKVIRGILRTLALHATLLHGGATLAAVILIPPLLPIVYGEAYRVAAFPFVIIAVLHLSLVLHAVTTPILRLYSKTHWAVIANIAGMTGSAALFVGLSRIIPQTHALYTSLFFYHAVISLLVFPISRLLRRG